jgi:DNA uptake protein ComE-like DNA-binding protein
MATANRTLSKSAFTLFTAATMSLSLGACSMQRASDTDTKPNQSAQQSDPAKPDNTKEAQDNGRKLGEKAREAEIQTREDRTKIKEGAREAGKKIKKGTEELAVKASAAAEGIRQGWNERNSNPNAIDINHASSTDLISLGLSRSEVKKIVAGRPYKDTKELSDRGIVSPATYRGLSDRITAK